MEWFARLEVDRAVLDLNDDVARELAVQRLELVISLLSAVISACGVYECPPDDGSAVRLQRLGEHVGAVGVGPMIFLWARLTLGIRLDQEAAEVRDQPVDLVGLRL